MKNIIIPVVTIFAASLMPAFALTHKDIVPAALRSKTLTFKIENGGAPYATTGSWTATFPASGNVFTAKKVTGDFVNVTSTYTSEYLEDDFVTHITVPNFIKGQKPMIISLLVDEDGVGRYEVFNYDVMDVSLNGTFQIGASAANGPDISVLQPATKELADNKGKTKFGSVKVGKTGPTKTFTIKNTGDKPLTNIALSWIGTNANDFKLVGPSKKTLAPGAKTTFKVTFKPRSKGTKKTVLLIKSNDKDESPFDINITGNAVK